MVTRKIDDEAMLRSMIENLKDSLPHDCTVCANMIGRDGDGVVCAPMEWKMANYRRIVPKVCSCSRFHFDLEQFSVERLGGVK